MPRPVASPRDTSIGTYRSKRDFATTREPPPSSRKTRKKQHLPIFVVQKHKAHRAGLHWDFRLEHGGVLWSWAVRKGPSLDPADKRIAAHVEDHPLDYAAFQGSIPDGQYGAGTVETWDRGTWEPLVDPETGLRDGEIKFILSGQRLHGRFTLIRLKPRPGDRGHQENWLLIKGHDQDERPGADANVLEAIPFTARTRNQSKASPIPGAVRGRVPERPMPELASVADAPPDEDDWLTEIKFDGYRLLVAIEHGKIRVLTRNGNDWTDRLPAVADAVSRLNVGSALLDGELVALDQDGVSSFPALQAALSDGRDDTLFFFLFDLMHLDDWDLRPCALIDRKEKLRTLDKWTGMLRFSDHHLGDAARMRQAACKMKLEGVICKKANAPYQSGRSHDWLKVKCQGREEMLILGWTEPAGTRQGLGSLHLGYYDPNGELNYAGGCGSGFSDETLTMLRDCLGRLASTPPKALLIAGDDLDRSIHWVRPDLIAEISFTAWSGAGRVRHAVFLGLREDKTPDEVVRPLANPEEKRRCISPRDYHGSSKRRGPTIAIPPKHVAETAAREAASKIVRAVPPGSGRRGDQPGQVARPTLRGSTESQSHPARRSSIVTARPPKSRTETIDGITLTHPDKPMWPGITKHDLVEYWHSVADHALPGLAHRPLAILRCPDGIDGEHFFQKHSHGSMPSGVRDGTADKAPFLAIDDIQGLVALTQMSTIELHVWGATEDDPLHADQLVFDLDPGDGVRVPEIVAGAQDMRKRLEAIGFTPFCRTSGGKGLHVVVPLVPKTDWDTVRPFCKAFAEAASEANPDKYLAHVKITDRKGRILIDWLRNGLGSTAVASFCPRARPGAGVATPLAWKEVTPKLDLQAFTVKTIPDRLKRLKTDPWEGFEEARRPLPDLPGHTSGPQSARSSGKARIVTTKPPKPRSS